MSDIDDDLKNLLNQLDDDEDIVRNIEPSTIRADLDENINSEALRPVETVIVSNNVDIEDRSPDINVSKYLDKMEGVADEVLQACRSDRQEAQEVINMLRNQCDQAHDKNIPPARMYVDGLVKSVEVKANINTNAVKVMEGVAKMIAATKAGLNINNNNVSVSAAELDEILSSNEVTGELD